VESRIRQCDVITWSHVKLKRKRREGSVRRDGRIYDGLPHKSGGEDDTTTKDKEEQWVATGSTRMSGSLTFKVDRGDSRSSSTEGAERHLGHNTGTMRVQEQ
jgi:hypothetical protein